MSSLQYVDLCWIILEDPSRTKLQGQFSSGKVRANNLLPDILL